MKSIRFGALVGFFALACSGGGDPSGEEVVDATQPQLNRYDGPARPAGPKGEITLADDAGGFRTWKYQVIDGYAVAEGDIVLGTLEELELQSKGLVRTDRLWPKRTLTYTLNSNLTATQKTRITDAMKAWTNATGVVFAARRAETDYVEFTQLAGRCDSQVGRVGGKQLIRLDANGCQVPAIIHEIGHALNLEHEHTRSDRDNVIDYYPERTEEEYRFAFDINNQSVHKRIGSLDFLSIMMYDSYAFAALEDGTPCNRGDADCLPTLTKKDSDVTWRSTSTLSAGDIKAFRTIYNVFQLPTVKTDRAAKTDIRHFANSTTNKVQFCKDNGYTTADTPESTQTLPANTLFATWNSATKKWDSGQINSAIGGYTKITCKF